MNNPMPQNALGIDMGQIMSNVSNLKTAKMNRDITGTKFEHYKHDRRLQEARVSKEKAAIEEEYGKRGIRTDLPKEELEVISKFDENQKKAAKEINDEIGSVLIKVEESENPAETYKGYQLLVNKYGEDALKNVSPEYSEENVATYLASTISLKDALEGRESRIKFNREQKGKVDLENLKQKGRVALESLKEEKTTKTKVQKLMEYRNELRNKNASKEDIDIVNKAIKLTSEGKESEAEKMMKMMLELDNPGLSEKAQKGETSTQTANVTADDYLKGL